MSIQKRRDSLYKNDVILEAVTVEKNAGEAKEEATFDGGLECSTVCVYM